MFTQIVSGQFGLIAKEFGGILGLMLSFQGLILICTTIGLWNIFKKAGEKPWKALIPFYRLFVQYKLTWKTLFFWFICVLGVLQVIVEIFLDFYYQDFLFYLVYFVVDILFVALIVIGYYRLIKSFNCETGMIIGFIFLEPIFIIILGFDKHKYIGNVYLEEKQQANK